MSSTDIYLLVEWAYNTKLLACLLSELTLPALILTLSSIILVCGSELEAQFHFRSVLFKEYDLSGLKLYTLTQYRIQLTV